MPILSSRPIGTSVGQPSFRIEQTYEYDQVGNWIATRVKTLILEGKPIDEITDIRRKIKYF